MQQMNLPIPPAPISEAERRAAWRRVPGHGDHDYARFAADPAVRRALEATVRAGRRGRQRRRGH